ncbi:class I SAM-dependent methyltransferase [Peribacillus sp. NPDC056705]|uniref:class I SAM-dependent methyltransferase n=1 Tax=Peribacillus sp. NPDC056705 TaxID=3345918 RepID=UPI0037491F01
MKNEQIHSTEDILHMLDSFFREEGPWWNRFYSDRSKRIPFFVHAPDENLDQYVQNQLGSPGRVLELGCGAGRNAVYMARRGWTVDAVDLSEEAIAWGQERAKSAQVPIRFHCQNLFDLELQSNAYDLIYDSGCFHHILPHRRMSYLDLIQKHLKPGGYYGIVCFAAGSMGADMTDWDVYRDHSIKGGLGYTEEKLRDIFRDLELIESRRMQSLPQPGPLFGESFLWTALFRKTAPAK